MKVLEDLDRNEKMTTIKTGSYPWINGKNKMCNQNLKNFHFRIITSTD